MEFIMKVTKHITCPLNIKELSDKGVFAGYASVFNVVDSHNDSIEPGAFAASLKKRAGGKKVKLLWQHHTDEPIGQFRSIREDSHGLYVEAQLSLEVQKAYEAYLLLKTGTVEGLSIGYNTVKSMIDDRTGVRILTEIDLWEISLVTFPANPDAQITMVKDYSYQTSLARLGQEIDRARQVLSTR
jgi:uncharacterized protein